MRAMFRNVALALPLALLALPRPGLAGLAFKKLTIETAVQPDGTYTQLYHAEAVASDGETARRMGQMPLAFNPSLERLDIVEAYTLKQDGTRENVDASAVVPTWFIGCVNPLACGGTGADVDRWP